MVKVGLVALVAVSASLAVTGTMQAFAIEASPPASDGAAPSLPVYSRQSETETCLSGYGMENSSIVDCVARDETFKAILAKSWRDIDTRVKQSCLSRLTERHMNSYFYLDRCIRSAQKHAADPD